MDGLVESVSKASVSNDDCGDSIQECLLAMLNEQKNWDLTLVVGEFKEKLHCHKLVLMSRSPLLAEKLSGDVSELVIEDSDVETVELFLKFLYADEFTQSIPDAIRLVQLAHRYGVKPLLKHCEMLMATDLSVEDALQTFVTARKYSLTDLMKKAGVIMCRNFEQVARLPQLKQIDEDTLVYLMKQDDLPVEESKLFAITLSWASARMQSSGDQGATYADVLKNIIPHIRFPLMTAQEFATKVFPTQILPQNKVIDLFLYFNSDDFSREDIAENLPFSRVPRVKDYIVDLYENVSSLGKTVPTLHTSNQILRASPTHQDTMRFKLTLPVSKGKLVSIVLREPNYQHIKTQFPTTNSETTVTSLAIKTSGKVVFSTGPIMINRNQDVTVKTDCMLSSGKEYTMVVSFENSEVLKDTGDSGYLDGNYDFFSSSWLRSSISTPARNGVIKFDSLVMDISSQEYDSYYGNDYYPLGLHVVRALKFTL